MTQPSPVAEPGRSHDVGTNPQAGRSALFLALFCLLAVTPLLFMWLGESLSVQRCLEAGGSFDYERMVCDFDREHAVPPFHERHRALLIATAVALPIAVALWRWGPRLGRTR